MRLVLIKKMKQLGEYVINESGGKITPLISSGFPIVMPGSEVILSEPVGFKISPGPKNGEMILQVRRVMGAKSYLYEYTPDPLTPESHWRSAHSTRCKMVLRDLPLGIKFWFRMAAIGPRNQVMYTDVLERYVA